MKIDSCVDNFVYFMLLWSSTSICWRQLYFLRLLWRHTATTLTPPHTPTHTPTHAHNYRYTIQSASRASSVMSRYLLESSLVSTRAGFTARQIITRHSRTSSPPVVCDGVWYVTVCGMWWCACPSNNTWFVWRYIVYIVTLTATPHWSWSCLK